MFDYTIYTDGSYKYKYDIGAYAFIILKNEKPLFYKRKTIIKTSSNAMELFAVIQALKQIKKPSKIEIFSDSAYTVNCVKLGWLDKWKNNGWLNSNMELVKNLDLMKEYSNLVSYHKKVKLNHVKGHSSVFWNEFCDDMCNVSIMEYLSKTIQ